MQSRCFYLKKLKKDKKGETLMGLKIISGRRSGQLSQGIYQAIGEKLKENEDNLYLLVPEQFTLGAEAGLIKENKLKGLLGVEVLSPKRLGIRVLKESGGLNKMHMDRHGRNILLQKALVEVQEELTIYQPVIRQSGFLKKFASLISELKENELRPEDFREIPLASGLLKQKLVDIGLIYEKYMALMGDNRLDEEDFHNLFCQKIKDVQFLKDASIFIDGFQNFSLLDYRLIENLMTQAKAVIIALPFDSHHRDAEVFKLTANTLERLKLIAMDHQLSFFHESLIAQKPGSLELSFLEKNLFAYPPETLTGPIENIRLFENQTIWDEVENGAAQILQLIREKNTSYGEIVVLAGDLELYANVIKGVFTQYEIPFFLDELRPIGDNHLIEAVITALEAIAGNYPSDAIFAYAKTGFSPISYQASRDLENYSLEFNIRGSLWRKPFTLISQNPALDLQQLNESRETLIQPLEDLRAKIKGSKSCTFMTTALYEFLEATKVSERLEQILENLSAKEDIETLEAYQQIWTILMKVFDQLVETMGEDIIQLDEYIRLLKAGISDYQLGLIPPQGNFITITDLRRSRSQAFSTLFVFGLNEGKIPGVGTEANLITDAERRILDSHQVHLQNNLAFQMEQEQFLIYDVLTRPQERLFIYWALSDLEGNSLQPSHLLSRLLTIFPDISITSSISQTSHRVWEQINRPEISLWKLIQYQKKQILPANEEAAMDQAREETLIWQTVREWIENSSYKSQYQEGLKALNYNGIQGSLLADQAEKLYGRKMTTSISRLEQFVKCPFSHYVKYGLTPGKRLAYTVEAPEIGNLLHEVVDGFFKRVAAENLELTALKDHQKEKIISDLMKERLPKIKKNVFNSRYQYQYLGKKLERVGTRSIDQIINQIKAGKFVPEKTEFQFEKPLKPLVNGQVTIQGKIDRLDIYRRQGKTWIKIIDYKTGNKNLRYEDIYYGLSLQLVVYLDGALTVLNEENLMPGGIFYFHVDDPILRMDINIDPQAFNKKLEKELNKAFKLQGLLCDNEAVIAAMDENRDKSQSDILPVYGSEALLNQQEFQLLLDYVRDLMRQQIKRIYGGEIKAQPYRKDQLTGCSYCDYQGICQFDPEISQEGYLPVTTTMKKQEFFERIEKKQEGDNDKKVD